MSVEKHVGREKRPRNTSLEKLVGGEQTLLEGDVAIFDVDNNADEI